MAISLIGKPTNNNNPVYNPLVYFFDSTNKAQPGFRYVAKVLNENNVFLFEKTIIPAFITGFANLNLNRELSDFINPDFSPNFTNLVNSSGFNDSGGYFRFKLDIGEEFFVTWDFFDFEFNGTVPQYNPNNLQSTTALATTDNSNVPPYQPGDMIFVNFTTLTPSKPQLQGVQEVLAVNARPGGGWHVALNIGWVGSGPTEGGSTRFSDNRKTRITGLFTSINNECAFNSVFNTKSFLSYNMNDFLMTGSSGNKDILSQFFSGYKVLRNNEIYINWMCNDVLTNHATKIEFTSDDGTVTHLNISVNALQWVKRINVGPTRTQWGNVISGAGAIVKPATKTYTFKFLNAANTAVSKTYRVNIDDSCQSGKTVTMVFMDKLGSSLPFNFTMRNVETQTVSRQEYTRYLGILSGNKYTYDLKDGGSEIYDSSFDRTFTLRTGYLTEQESKFFANVIHSPSTMIDIDGDKKFERCNIITNAIEIKQDKWYELKRYEIQVILSNSNKINV